MKLKHFTLISFALLLFSFSSFAQHRNCGAMENLEFQKSQDDKIEKTIKNIEKHTQQFINNPEKVVTGVVNIPVVVHVIYQNSSQNISDAQILSQIAVLNEDFRRTNSDANNTWSQAADSEIEFCMASVDPSGNATNGITRKNFNRTSWGTNDEMKYSSNGGTNAWPTGDYLNMWVCNIGGGILGYAQFPGSGSAATDGVVISPQYFGNTGTASAPFDLGRTTTHEVGHWLNLRHIWGDGNCNADDFVTDTPTSDAANYGCASGHVSCSSTDMVENYMDYSDDACMNLYTQGQKTRMRALFDTGGFRESLLSSNGCGAGTTPTCSDGVQNGNETGVDCGGSCTPCSSGCTENDLVISITLDTYPEETSWTLTDSNGGTVGSGGTYGSEPDNSTVTASGCLADDCYTFTINDTYGDGICCGYGNGSYTVTNNGGIVASGGSFGASESTTFCFGGGSTPTCTDGVQNGSETGVDCGGSCVACPTCTDGVQNGNETGVDCGGDCNACPTCDDGVQNGDETGVDCGGSCAPCNTGGGCTTVLIDDENFDSGWGIWNDGGSDCARINYSPYASSGNYSIRIRDNTGSISSMTTDNLNLSGFEEVYIDFGYYPVSMENGEDFWLQGSLDGGSTWTTVATWARGTDFQNNGFYTESLTITGTYTNTTKWRFRCDASSNNDRVYIDDVVISGCVNGNRQEMPIVTEPTIAKAEVFVTEEDVADQISELQIYPNPVHGILNMEFALKNQSEVAVTILDVNGKIISTQMVDGDVGKQKLTIDATDFDAGFYFVMLQSGKETITKRFIAIK